MGKTEFRMGKRKKKRDMPIGMDVVVEEEEEVTGWCCDYYYHHHHHPR